MAFVDQRDRDLRALLEVTRPITPEEMAELQLEQGYADRALSIYDELAAREPANTAYATRRAWLARIVARSPGPRRAAPPYSGSLEDRRSKRPARSSLPPASTTEQTGPLRTPPPATQERTLEGLGPKTQAHGSALVRRLPIVGVR